MNQTFKIKDDCIFCRIIKKDIKSYQIGENDNWIVILDASPITYGHSLVISKKHYKNYLLVDEEILNGAHNLIKKTCEQLRQKLHAKGFNITTNINREANQVIFHMHWHIIPRYDPIFEHKKERLNLNDAEFVKLSKLLEIIN